MRTAYRYLFMEWECCGLVWQLQMSIYPARKEWKPVCPYCNAEGKSYKEYLSANRIERRV